MGTLLSEKKQAEIEAAEIGVKCLDSFYYFFKMFWPEMSGSRFVDAPHIKYICDTLQSHAMKVIRREDIRRTLIINVPPSSSKSTIVTIAFPIWVWLHDPTLASTNVSYSGELSKRHANKSRAITDSTKWHILFDNIFKVKHGKALEILIQNNNQIVNNFKGERFNSSVDGAITGMHADFIIKDDMQDPKMAKSDTQRVHVNEWDQETLTNRHKDQNCFLDIIIAQRLHEDDLSGHTLNKNIDIVHVCLPAQITNVSNVIPKSAESIYIDGILDPLRKPLEALEQLKQGMTSGPYTCQYLQAPFNLEEQAIRPSMFEIIDPRDDMTFDLWIDGAYTEKTENDPTGITVTGFKDHTLYIKQAYNVYKTLPDLVKFIKELGEAKIFDPDKGRIFIEPKASGYSLAQYIESETDYNFVLIGQNTSKDEKNIVSQGKTARHTTIQPKAESGRIKLFKGNWNDDYLTQICGFPRAAHDEQVDNTGYAVHHYFITQNTFIEDWAIKRLEKNVPGSINVTTSHSINKYKITAEYRESDSGDVQLFDVPNTNIYNYRYLCVLVLRAEGERGGKTTITVFDRVNMFVAAYFESEEITPQKAGKKALEMAALFDKAKLVVAVQKEVGTTQNEENDLSHIAIQEARKIRYDNIYSRLSVNNIKLDREREYGFQVNRSTTREVYYNLKEFVETNKITDVPLEILNDIKLLERKKETGEVNGREGYQVNAVLSYAIALKIHEEMYDKPSIKRNSR
ncbi:MAG: hypothetical protein LLF95_11230 [Bacteroidales bacterium]|nr:hypothetical protein [Bacteroidales bacterium]